MFVAASAVSVPITHDLGFFFQSRTHASYLAAAMPPILGRRICLDSGRQKWLQLAVFSWRHLECSLLLLTCPTQDQDFTKSTRQSY